MRSKGQRVITALELTCVTDHGGNVIHCTAVKTNIEHYGNEAGLELTGIHLSLNAGIKGSMSTCPILSNFSSSDQLYASHKKQ